MERQIIAQRLRWLADAVEGEGVTAGPVRAVLVVAFADGGPQVMAEGDMTWDDVDDAKRALLDWEESGQDDAVVRLMWQMRERS